MTWKRCSLSLIAVMLLVGASVVVQGRIKVSESADSQSVPCLQCRVVAQVPPPAQSGQTGGPSSDELVRSLESALSQGKIRKAHNLLNEVLKSPYLTSDTLLRVGIQFAERERYEEAAEAFERCIQEHPDAFEAYYNLALAEIAEGKWEDALATLQQAPQKSRSAVLACSYLRGKVEGSQGKATQAEHDLSAAFEGEPQNLAYGMDLGLFYIQEHKYFDAAAVFERARNRNPGSPFLVLGLALSRFLAGQPERSIDALRMLLSTHANFAPARVLMTFVLSAQGKLEDAERIAHQGLNSPHASPYLYYLDASVLVKLRSQQYTRIFEELSLARRGIPSCSLCYLTESKAHQSQGNIKAAIADLEMATRIDPTFSEAWYRLASLYRRAGREAEASRAQDQFQELRAEKEGREVQVLRDNFLQTLSAAPAAR